MFGKPARSCAALNATENGCCWIRAPRSGEDEAKLAMRLELSHVTGECLGSRFDGAKSPNCPESISCPKDSRGQQHYCFSD
jgi:hypothetical protein